VARRAELGTTQILPVAKGSSRLNAKKLIQRPLGVKPPCHGSFPRILRARSSRRRAASISRWAVGSPPLARACPAAARSRPERSTHRTGRRKTSMGLSHGGYGVASLARVGCLVTAIVALSGPVVFAQVPSTVCGVPGSPSTVAPPCTHSWVLNHLHLWCSFSSRSHPVRRSTQWTRQPHSPNHHHRSARRRDPDIRI
jgi:hypothetical protein